MEVQLPSVCRARPDMLATAWRWWRLGCLRVD